MISISMGIHSRFWMQKSAFLEVKLSFMNKHCCEIDIQQFCSVTICDIYPNSAGDTYILKVIHIFSMVVTQTGQC